MGGFRKTWEELRELLVPAPPWREDQILFSAIINSAVFMLDSHPQSLPSIWGSLLVSLEESFLLWCQSLTGEHLPSCTFINSDICPPWRYQFCPGIEKRGDIRMPPAPPMSLLYNRNEDTNFFWWSSHLWWTWICNCWSRLPVSQLPNALTIFLYLQIQPRDCKLWRCTHSYDLDMRKIIAHAHLPSLLGYRRHKIYFASSQNKNRSN